jgi:hypothetical protein
MILLWSQWNAVGRSDRMSSLHAFLCAPIGLLSFLRVLIYSDGILNLQYRMVQYDVQYMQYRTLNSVQYSTVPLNLSHWRHLDAISPRLFFLCACHDGHFIFHVIPVCFSGCEKSRTIVLQPLYHDESHVSFRPTTCIATTHHEERSRPCVLTFFSIWTSFSLHF